MHNKSLKNKILFGAVREDPQIEIELISRFSLNSLILIGSGGCTALSIKSRFPKIRLSIIEPNSAQVKLIKKKIKIIKSNTLKDIKSKFGVETNPSLIESGQFELLFKVFREFIYGFIISKTDFLNLIQSNPTKKWKPIFQNPLWKTAFDLYFSDTLLIALFGAGAVQHAPKNSYSRYFKKIIERGLTRFDAKTNYFLHHIFFGHYLKSKQNWPLYLQKPPKEIKLSFNECYANQYTNYDQFDLVSLSNIFDWTPRSQIKNIAKTLLKQMKPNTVLLYRQLNNTHNFKNCFKGFKWQTQLEKKLLDIDRSLFYSKICIGKKI